MLKFTLITTLILGVSALILKVSGKLIRSPEFLDLESYNDVDFRYQPREEPAISTDTVWILNLDSDLIDPLKVRAASKMEAEEFAAAAEPLMDSIDRRHTKPTRKSQPKPVITSDLKSLKADITRTVNKFILSAGAEPDVELTQDNQSPTITLFFRGPYSSLFLNHGRNQWHFFINPPSPLPSWFYDRPSGVNQVEVEIPGAIEKEFFWGLLRLLRVFLSQPL